MSVLSAVTPALRFLAARAKEPSTSIVMGGLLGMLRVNVDQDDLQTYLDIGIGIFSALGILLPEGPHPEQSVPGHVAPAPAHDQDAESAELSPLSMPARTALNAPTWTVTNTPAVQPSTPAQPAHLASLVPAPPTWTSTNPTMPTPPIVPPARMATVAGLKTGSSAKDQAVTEIRAECAKQGIGQTAQVAYVLATVEHETAGTFRPVREAYWLKDPDAYLKKAHPDYYPFYGRGYVQLTWKANYANYGALLGIDLVGNPDLALDPAIARFVLVHGFKTGAFTGKSISDYVNGGNVDFVNARRCINGIDKAHEIASIAHKWLAKLG